MTRWLGVGLAAILSVVTLSLAVTDRLILYIAPDGAWFAIGMAVIALVGTVGTFLLPLGAESDHGHDHGTAPLRGEAADTAPEPVDAHLDRRRPHEPAAHDRLTEHHPAPTPAAYRPLAIAASVTGGIAASSIVVLSLVLPPATLSAEIAMSRDVGAAPLFAGQDTVALATMGDTSQFGVGQWASVFATATNPDAFDGTPVTLTGFATPGETDFQLTRLVITHCVIDAQTATLPIAASGAAPATGQWVTVTGTVRSSSDGRLVIDAASVEPIDEPADPYEF